MDTFSVVLVAVVMVGLLVTAAVVVATYPRQDEGPDRRRAD